MGVDRCTAVQGTSQCRNHAGFSQRTWLTTRPHAATDFCPLGICPSGISESINLFADNTHTHTRPFNCPLSGTTRVSRYQKGKTNLDFTEARDSEWQWHQLGHMQVCTSLQTDNHTSTPSLSFLQAGCPSCRPTNSVKALKAMNCTLSVNVEQDNEARCCSNKCTNKTMTTL